MPQVDLETLFRIGSGRKIACETQIEPAQDNPAESVRVPVEDEIDWVDRHAGVLHHNQSTKGGGAIRPNLTTNTSNSSSKRFKSKRFIIGLPKRPDSAQLCDPSSRRRCSRPPRIRLFPKSTEAEPESPKVSCIGRIRSKKAKDNGRFGFWARFVAVFGCDRKISDGVSIPASESAKRSSEKKVSAEAAGRIPTAEAPVPALGGLKKFSSGRHSASWGQVETNGHVA